MHVADWYTCTAGNNRSSSRTRGTGCCRVSALTEDLLASGSVHLSGISVAVSWSGLFQVKERESSASQALCHTVQASDKVNKFSEQKLSWPAKSVSVNERLECSKKGFTGLNLASQNLL